MPNIQVFILGTKSDFCVFSDLLNKYKLSDSKPHADLKELNEIFRLHLFSRESDVVEVKLLILLEHVRQPVRFLLGFAHAFCCFYRAVFRAPYFAIPSIPAFRGGVTSSERPARICTPVEPDTNYLEKVHFLPISEIAPKQNIKNRIQRPSSRKYPEHRH